MNFFDEATLRLKQQFKTTEDRELAAVLGLAPNAWAMRKKRGSFPAKELRALAQQRPELGIDVDYVLTGEGMRHITGKLSAKTKELANAALTMGSAAADSKKRAAAVAGKRLGAKETATLTASVAVGAAAEQSDEVRLLAAFRASNSAGRAAILLAARGISEISKG